jgi:hypothetical protein
LEKKLLFIEEGYNNWDSDSWHHLEFVSFQGFVLFCPEGHFEKCCSHSPIFLLWWVGKKWCTKKAEVPMHAATRFLGSAVLAVHTDSDLAALQKFKLQTLIRPPIDNVARVHYTFSAFVKENADFLNLHVCRLVL